MASVRADRSGGTLPHRERWRLLTSQWAFTFGPREVTMVIGKLDRIQRAPVRGEASVGSRVRLLDIALGETATLTLVKPREAAPKEGRISIYSPLGARLLGVQAGNTIEVPLLSRRFRFHVLEVAGAGNGAG